MLGSWAYIGQTQLHFDTASILLNLGSISRVTGKLSCAEKWFIECLEILKRVMAVTDGKRFVVLNILAEISLDNCNLEDYFQY